MSNSTKLLCDLPPQNKVKWSFFFAHKKHQSIKPVSHPPSLSEAESGLKHVMILNEIQYMNLSLTEVMMHINIFRKVQ